MAHLLSLPIRANSFILPLQQVKLMAQEHNLLCFSCKLVLMSRYSHSFLTVRLDEWRTLQQAKPDSTDKGRIRFNKRAVEIYAERKKHAVLDARMMDCGAAPRSPAQSGTVRGAFRLEERHRMHGHFEHRL